MVTTAFFGSWLAYLAITFALGFVWHLVVFKDLYRRLAIYSRIDDPIVPLGFLSILIQGAVLAYLYPLVAQGGTPLVSGLQFGMLMGLFIASSGSSRRRPSSASPRSEPGSWSRVYTTPFSSR